MIDGNYLQFQKIVELNAGAAIYLAGKCSNIKDGALIASKAINEGMLKNLLKKLLMTDILKKICLDKSKEIEILKINAL